MKIPSAEAHGFGGDVNATRDPFGRGPTHTPQHPLHTREGVCSGFVERCVIGFGGLIESFDVKRTNLRNSGLISVDRSNKATLLRTIPGSVSQSSAKDLSSWTFGLYGRMLLGRSLSVCVEHPGGNISSLLAWLLT